MEASEARGTTRATRPHRAPLAKRQDEMGSERTQTNLPPPLGKELKELRLRNQNKLSFEQYTNMYSYEHYGQGSRLAAARAAFCRSCLSQCH